MGMREGNIMATIPTPQIPVNSPRATGSSIPAIGMLDCATRSQAAVDNDSNVPAKMATGSGNLVAGAMRSVFTTGSLEQISVGMESTEIYEDGCILTG